MVITVEYVWVIAVLIVAAIALSHMSRSVAAQPRTKQLDASNKRGRKTTTTPGKPLAQKIAGAVIAEKSLSSISDEELLQLMDIGIRVLDEEPARIDVNAPCYVFGDIHGNLPDFLKFFSDTNVEAQLLKLQPPKNSLLFLGDYVDRGDYSLEVIALLVSLKVLFKDKITLLRGNHEVMGTNAEYTFKDECKEKRKGHDRIYKRCNKLFTKLPLCAVVSKTFLCMHGGLPRPEGWDFLMGKDFTKPQTDEELDENETFCDLLWADPTNNSTQLRLDKSVEPDSAFLEEFGNYRFNRGRETSIQFNDLFAQEFFNRFPNIRGIFRAHEYYPQGHGMNEARTICTIFSSPRYEDKTGSGSILKVSADLNHIHFVTLKPKVEE